MAAIVQSKKCKSSSSVSKSSPSVPKPNVEHYNASHLRYNPNEPSTSVQNVNYNLAIINSIEMRADGKSWKEIADYMGYAQPAAIKKKVEEYIKEHLDSSIEVYRNVIGARLEMMALAIKKRADDGDITAINTQLKITDQAARLYGLNAPDKQLVSHIDFTMENLFELTFGKAIEAEVS